MDDKNIELDGLMREIDTLARADCLERWRAVFDRSPRKYLSAQFMQRVLIWEMQSSALGGVPAKTTRRLRQIASGKTQPTEARPGSHLVREWNGRTYQVEVTDRGYLLDGKRWSSLSAVASTLQARTGPVRASLECSDAPDPLRHLYPQELRRWAGSGLQLARCAEGGL